MGDITGFLPKRLRDSNIPEPIAIGELNKAKHLPHAVPKPDLSARDLLSDLFRQINNKSVELKGAILSIIKNHDLLNMISSWESRATEAASSSVNGLVRVAKRNTTDPSQLADSAASIAALISREAVGKKNAKHEPGRAFDAAMMDVLVDYFGKSVEDEQFSAAAKRVIAPLVKGESIPGIQLHTISLLNTLFQLDLNTNCVKYRDRGAVLSLMEATKQGLKVDASTFVWDDFLWTPDQGNSTSIPDIQDDVIDAIQSRLPGGGTANQEFQDAVRQIRTDRRAQLKSTRLAFEDEKPGLEAAFNWVLIEIGADCDHAQGKTRTLRYLVALEASMTQAQKHAYNTHGQLRNEAIRLLGPFHYEDVSEPFVLLVSLKRFTSWQLNRSDDELTIPVKYRLRKAVVDDLLHRYASWSSRRGIVEFRHES